jgi:hypothetical protein
MGLFARTGYGAEFHWALDGEVSDGPPQAEASL